MPEPAPRGRIIPEAGELCGGLVVVSLRVEDVDLPAHDLVVFEAHSVRVALVVMAECDHRPLLRQLYSAARARLEGGAG